MRYLLDTCFLSEFVKPEPDPGVIDWGREHDEGDLYISVLTVGEIEKGIARLSPSARKTRLTNWLEHDLCIRFRDRILPITVETARQWGRLDARCRAAGTVLPVIDGLLAATAFIADLTVVTDNVSDLQATGVRLHNPWTHGRP